jgi:urease accessory protein
MKKLMISLTTLMATAGVAQAHVGVDHTLGLTTGFLHPIMGLDHLLAMVAVGVFAVRLGGRALWAVPLSFVIAMVIGGFIGATGAQLPFVEVMIAASVILLGTCVALNWKAPLGVAATLVAGFAVFHGHAHGAEMPVEASAYIYAAGFVAATAMLHLAGVGLAYAALRISSARSVQAAGAACTAAGLALMGGWV